jgi:diacylglycerol kinase (ATP)
MNQIKKVFISFTYAGRGILSGFKERNMKVHGLATILVIIFGLISKLDRYEWAIISILIAFVWAAELFNSSIEDLSDLVRDTEKLSYKATKRVRDLSAGAVLVSAIVAVIVGYIIFFN